MKKLAALLFLPLLLASCDQPFNPSPQRTLPPCEYGRPVPDSFNCEVPPLAPGMEIAKDALAHLNIAHDPNADIPTERPGLDFTAQAQTHSGRGYRVTPTSANPWTAIQARHDVQPYISLPPAQSGENDSLLYAPTLMAPGGSCIESVTVHRRLVNSTVTRDYYGFWAWCGPDIAFDYYSEMTAGWLDRYTAGGSDPTVLTAIKKVSSTCWEGYLFDYTQGKYALIMGQCGSSVNGSRPRGWSMHEEYGVTSLGCPTLTNIKATGILLGKYGGAIGTPIKESSEYWDPLQFGNCWGGGWGFQQPAPNYPSNSWQGLTE